MTNHSTRYGWQQRLVAVVLMFAAILVAGAISRVADAVDEADSRLYAEVGQGESIRIGEHATLRITGISIGGSMTERDALVASSGRYVLVEYEVSAGIRKAPNVRTELHADGNVYREIESAYDPLPAGFAGNRAGLFEVPTDVLAGDVAIVFGESELVYSHQHWVRWHPELTEDVIDRSEAATVALPETEMWVA